jgi:general L-amino acid transport system permease protein
MVLRDLRYRSLILQGALLLSCCGLAGWLAYNTAANLSARGIQVGFDYLWRPARYPISEGLLSFEPIDSFARGYVVGLVNTLFVSAIVVTTSTALGLMLALMRRSRHPLTFGIATTYVEALRNTPLVVQLLFWYAIVTTVLPPSRQALQPLPGFFLSIRGLFLPAMSFEGDVALLACLTVAVAAGLAWIFQSERRRQVETGLRRPLRWIALAVAVAFVAASAWLLHVSVHFENPRLQGFNFIGGTRFTPEFASLVLGLILYSAAFTGEIIRGGIDAVGKGQWEAARALGLSEWRLLRLVVLPQALRVIIPPMTSQYFNIVKNTTLALVVGYPDLSFVVATTINQTGQVIEGVFILVAVFLSISAAISIFMNWHNRRIALVHG